MCVGVIAYFPTEILSFHHSVFSYTHAHTHVTLEMPADMSCSFQPTQAFQFEFPPFPHIIELDFF